MLRLRHSAVSHLGAFLQDCGGAAVPLIAFGLIACISVGALAIDYARLSLERQSLEIAADAAALAAAARLPDLDAVEQAALDYVEKNMPVVKYGNVLLPADIQVGNYNLQTRTFTPISDPSDTGTAVRVTPRLSEANGNAVSLLFGRVLGSDSQDLSATAIAGRRGPPCILVLDSSEPSSMLVAGSASVETSGCGVQVNSTASPAFETKGNGYLSATDICVGGTSLVSGNSTVSPNPTEYCPGQNDPLSGLERPASGGCDHNNAEYVATTETLEPGTYCGGIEIDDHSTITLNPGTYIIQDGPLALKDHSTLTGTGVTLYFTGPGAVVNFQAGASLDLTAPTSGDLSGILLFQDPDFGGTHDWKGKVASHLQGVIYFPSGKLYSKNDNTITPLESCTVLIVGTLEFSSSSGVSIDVSGADCRSGLPGPYRNGISLLQ